MSQIIADFAGRYADRIKREATTNSLHDEAVEMRRRLIATIHAGQEPSFEEICAVADAWRAWETAFNAERRD